MQRSKKRKTIKVLMKKLNKRLHHSKLPRSNRCRPNQYSKAVVDKLLMIRKVSIDKEQPLFATTLLMRKSMMKS